MQAFPLRGRCPSAHAEADEVRPFKPLAPSADHRNRAARCTAPTGWSGFPSAGDRKGRPYGFTGALPEIWRAGEDTRPYGGYRSRPPPFVGAGHWPARRCTRRVQEAAPYSPAPVATCSAKPGAEVEPHQPQFSTKPGPSGPAGI